MKLDAKMPFTSSSFTFCYIINIIITPVTFLSRVARTCLNNLQHQLISQYALAIMLGKPSKFSMTFLCLTLVHFQAQLVLPDYTQKMYSKNASSDSSSWEVLRRCNRYKARQWLPTIHKHSKW